MSKMYSDIGMLLKQMGKYNDSLKYHEEALKVRKKVLGEKNILVANSYDHIGSIYRIIGKKE